MYSVLLRGNVGFAAVLKVDALNEDLLPVRVGSASGLKVGQYVFALGNPSGFSKTQTSGVVSGLNRAIPSPVGTRIPGAIQTDAAISSGAVTSPIIHRRSFWVVRCEMFSQV